MRIAWLGVLGACWSEATPAIAPPPVGAAPEAPRVERDPDPGRMKTAWANVVTTDGCWYFSGPDGRDTKLTGDAHFTRDGTNVTMAWDNAKFTGTFKAGQLDLHRKSDHLYGNDWSADEHITGPYREGTLLLHYRYEECDTTAPPCPGRCTIDADLTVAKHL